MAQIDDACGRRRGLGLLLRAKAFGILVGDYARLGPYLGTFRGIGAWAVWNCADSMKPTLSERATYLIVNWSVQLSFHSLLRAA
jgi:hypothetical protein